MATAPPPPPSPDLLSRLVADLHGDPERWKYAARIALGGLAIIWLQMALRFEVIYPGMSILLIVSHLRGAGSIARFVLNVAGATIGCSCAIALGALFIQQPWFLLACLWTAITLVMYFMPTSRYSSAFFAAGYPFIVINFMMFFDKAGAERIGIAVYQSVLVGLCVTSLVTILLWPEPSRKSLCNALARNLRTTSTMLRKAVEGALAREGLRAQVSIALSMGGGTHDCLALLEKTQGDQAIDPEAQTELLTIVAFDRRASASVALMAAELGSGAPVTAEERAFLESLSDALDALASAIADPATEDALADCIQRVAACTGMPMRSGLQPLMQVASELPSAAKALSGVRAISRESDFGSVALSTLARSPGLLFRQSIRTINDSAFAHAAKCSTAILICAITCITLNWQQGIGCVETVMLVVQTTLGGTLLIGSLRLIGVVVGFTLAILAIIFIVPTTTTFVGLAMIFGPMLLLTAYGTHGPERISTASIQVMIVFDFALLQTTNPTITLLPARNFALAVTMGVLVSFAVYRLMYRVRAIEQYRSARLAMLACVQGLVTMAGGKPVAPARIREAQLRLDDSQALCLRSLREAQCEPGASVEVVAQRLDEATDTRQLCLRILAEAGSPEGVQGADAQQLVQELAHAQRG